MIEELKNKDIKQIKELLQPYIGSKVMIKVENRKRRIGGTLENVDYYIFGGGDFGQFISIFLKREKSTMVIKLKGVEAIDRVN